MSALEILANGEIEIEGLIHDSSNGALKVTITLNDETLEAILKPDVSIRPLWDFPDRDLNKREYSTYLFDQALNLNNVPSTVIRNVEGIGNALIQEWKKEIENDLVIVKSPDEIPKGYLKVLQGYDELNKLITLAHKDSDQLRRMCLFDLIINNADRKGGHLLNDQNHNFWAIDHGVTWHKDSKIRTVLWGWINKDFNDQDLELLKFAEKILKDWETEEFPFLEPIEIKSGLNRIQDLLTLKRFPQPGEEWPAVPWPIF